MYRTGSSTDLQSALLSISPLSLADELRQFAHNDPTIPPDIVPSQTPTDTFPGNRRTQSGNTGNTVRARRDDAGILLPGNIASMPIGSRPPGSTLTLSRTRHPDFLRTCEGEISASLSLRLASPLPLAHLCPKPLSHSIGGPVWNAAHFNLQVLYVPHLPLPRTCSLVPRSQLST